MVVVVVVVLMDVVVVIVVVVDVKGCDHGVGGGSDFDD